MPVPGRRCDYQKSISRGHPPSFHSTRRFVSNLAMIYFQLDDGAKAEPLYRRALDIQEKASGPEHPIAANALEKLGFIALGRGMRAEALDNANRAQSATLATLFNVLSFTSEEQR